MVNATPYESGPNSEAQSHEFARTRQAEWGFSAIEVDTTSRRPDSDTEAIERHDFER